MFKVKFPTVRQALLLQVALAGLAPGAACAAPAQMPTGQFITPTLATGAVFQTLNPGLAGHPNYRAGQALKTALSPDGSTLLIMTSGYNKLSYESGANIGNNDPAASNEYIFVFDVSGTNAQAPKQRQVLQVPNSFVGLVFAPDGSRFYAAGGINDSVFVFSKTVNLWAQSSVIALNHPSFGANLTGANAGFAAFVKNGVGILQSAETAGLAITPDGKTLVATNIGNDSISVIDTASGTVSWDYDLRPFNTTPVRAGLPGGETPFAVAIKGSAASGYVAYVSALRDREMVVVPLGNAAPAANSVVRIALPGSPNSVLLSADQSRLFVAQDNSDTVAVIDTQTNAVIEEISTSAPNAVFRGKPRLTGAAPNGLALSPDGNTLYVTNGGANSLALISLAGLAPHHTRGLVPTGWYPHSVSVSADGKTLYVVNGKSDPGPNPNYTQNSANQYVEQLQQAGFLTVPTPAKADLAGLTQAVVSNNGYGSVASAQDAATMAFLHHHIHHVIYIIKENRTFDQILGDLTNGANADPAIVMYPAAITPNFHAISTNFVTLDNFYCSGEVSGDGWAWSTEGRESDFGVKTIPPNYAGRGFQNDSEGLNRIVNVALTPAGRVAAYPNLGGDPTKNIYNIVGSAFPGGVANLLPGTANDFATDGPGGTPAQLGYLWDSAFRAGLSVRDYGFLVDIVRYNIPVAIGGADLIENPAATHTTIAWPANPTLAPVTDPYFRGFDNAYPDAWRLEEWTREFRQYQALGNLPNLSLVRLMHDHTGNFCSAPPPYTAAGCPAAGLNTPELQQADNDFAVGKLIETVAHSRYANDTLIFVLQDDSQDGPDHVDSHRSTAYVVGPYVKQHAVVSKRYSTVNMVRTMEDVLGIAHLNLNDAYQPPMTDVFDTAQKTWTYTATAATILKSTGLANLVNSTARFAAGPDRTPTHTGAWWAARTRGYNWTSEDKIPADAYNHVLWEGLKGDAPYPARKGVARQTADKDNDGD